MNAARPTWPRALVDSAARFDFSPTWHLAGADLDAVLAELGRHGTRTALRPLAQVVAGLPDLNWLRLSEVATAAPRAHLTAKLVGGLMVAAAAGGGGLVLNVGSDGAGRTGVAVGVPPDAVDRWCSTLATDLVWDAGTPYGWRSLAHGHQEVGWVGLPFASAGERATDAERPTSLDLVLAAGSSLGPWSLDVVLEPVPPADLETARDLALQMLLKSQEAVSRTRSYDETYSSTFNEARAEQVVLLLRQWHGLAQDALRVGGWDVSVRVRASSADDLSAVGTAFSLSLGEDVHTSDSVRRHAWGRSPVVPSAPACPTWLTSRELADLMLLSGESVGEVQSRRPLAAGRATVPVARPVRLGSWLGTALPAEIGLEDLTAHAFVAGITGSGKSTTTRTLLAALANEHDVPFLVIDPAKTDYADFGQHLKRDLRVVRAGDLTMNVLHPWPGRPADQHIARVGNAFRGAFSMPSPVPYVASILFEELGRDALVGEVTLHDGRSRLDSLVDELGYQGEIRDNILASLGLRLRLLLQPSRADRIAAYGAVPTWLTERPTVVQLGDIADEEERNFVAAMLVLYVSDAARAGGLSSGVRHVTVVEEAHRLMPEPRPTGPEEGDAGAVSARLMAQLLAEIRAYGESLVVIDQSPAAVSREALRNTNVKIVHRIVDRDDQRVLGGALGLDEDDNAMLGSLGVGRALISTSRLLRPQTAQVAERLDHFEHEMAVPDLVGSIDLCHHADRSRAHHAAERHGQEMELLVGLWTLGSTDDLRVSARHLVQLDPAVQASCLIRIGIRRHVRTLTRVNYLADGDAADHRRRLWDCAVRGDRPTPFRSDQRPFPGCVVCPDPCVARGVVASGGLTGYRRGQAALARSMSVEESLDAVLTGSKLVAEELHGQPAESVVTICTAVQLADTARVSASFIAEATQ